VVASTARPEIVVSVVGRLTVGETDCTAFLAAPKSQLVVMTRSPITHTNSVRAGRRVERDGRKVM
jgi:hypothetical protein